MNPLIQHAVTMAYHATDSSKLQSARSFKRLAATSSQVLKICQSREALDALKHLASQDAHDIATEAMEALLSLCKVEDKDILQDLIVEFEIMQFLSKQLMHYEIDVKVQASECIGELSKWNFISRRLVSDKALQPLCSLIRPNQNKKILFAACKSLSKISSFSEMMYRVIIVWGLTPLKEMIESLLEQIKIQIDTLQNMSPVERRMNSYKLDPSLDLLHSACSVWENFSKYEKLSVKMLSENVIQQLSDLLLFNNDVRIRIISAKCLLNLSEHKQIRTYILSKESILLLMFGRSNDSSFEVKHFLAKALDNLLESCTTSEHSYFKQLIEKEISNTFVDWMLKTVNCNHILVIALQALISSNHIITKSNQSAFGVEVFKDLMNKIKSSLDYNVKLMSTEVLYRFSKESCFRNDIMNAQVPEMLVYMLSSKEQMFRSFSVKTISQLCDNSERSTRFLELGITTSILKYYNSFISEIQDKLVSSNSSKLSDQELETLLNATKIILSLCDFGDFRNSFANHKALNSFLIVFDATNNVSLLICLLKILTKLIFSAGKEGAGNGNLKIITEKRLYRLIKMLATYELSTGSKLQMNILDLLKSFVPHQNIPLNGKKPFWEICFKEITKIIMPTFTPQESLPNEDYCTILIQFLHNILKSPLVQKDIEFTQLITTLFEILTLAPEFSDVKLYCAKSLLEVNSEQKSKFREYIVDHSEYLKRLQINAHSINETYKKMISYLNDFIDHFEENKLISQSNKRDNRPSEEEDDTNQKNIQSSLESKNEQNVKKDEFALLKEWKANLGVVPNYQNSLLDIQTQVVTLKVDKSKLIGDIDSKMERRMLRQIKEYERLQFQNNTHSKMW